MDPTQRKKGVGWGTRKPAPVTKTTRQAMVQLTVYFYCRKSEGDLLDTFAKIISIVK